MSILALYAVRSPFNSTGYLGFQTRGTNACTERPYPTFSYYWHKSATYDSRAFDVLPQPSGGSATVYLRVASNVGVASQVRARATSYRGGKCGVDVELSSASGVRRLRYYHVNPTSQIRGFGGNWGTIGTIGAYSTSNITLGTIWTTGDCSAEPNDNGHVHIDTAYTENGGCHGGDHYEWINSSLPKNPNGETGQVALSSGTTLFNL